jgi:hypothetical protein
LALAGIEAISRAITRSDYFRRAPRLGGEPSGHREWLHFCVRGDGVDVLVNFSLSDDTSAGAEQGHVATLVHAGGWTGSVDAFEGASLSVSRGSIDGSFGANRVRYNGKAFEVVTRSLDPRLDVDLAFSPAVLPAVAHNMPLPSGARTSWLAIPRLTVSGTVRLGDRVHSVHGAPGYHDHNWGRGLGSDFAWEWGYLAPRDAGSPWSCVFVRVGDRMRTSTWMQGLFLWRGSQPHRGYRGPELEVTTDGLLRQTFVPKFPGVASILCPGAFADVPRTLLAEGRADGDRVGFRFEATDVAQIVVPEDDARRTIINEVRGTATLHGVVGGERVAVEGDAFAEFVQGAT